ncbi:hypothetical protein [Phyllobacterium zundukense]|nr:hypothetical protein [Phyllobacterium zundukense]
MTVSIQRVKALLCMAETSLELVTEDAGVTLWSGFVSAFPTDRRFVLS